MDDQTKEIRGKWKSVTHMKGLICGKINLKIPVDLYSIETYETTIIMKFTGIYRYNTKIIIPITIKRTGSFISINSDESYGFK